MKRFACLLLLLLLPLISAGAEETEYESPYGFTLTYDDAVFTVTELDDADPETLFSFLLQPRQEGVMASMACAVLPPAEEDWTAEESPFALMEDDFDLAIRHACFCAQWEGENPAVEWNLCVFAPDDFFIFKVAFDEEAAAWGGQLWDVLHTLQFPPQPAVSGPFRLDFFQGGAAGMQFIPVVVEEEAEEPITLRCFDTVRDFVLEKVIWDEETMEPAAFEPLYAAHTFGPGDNLNIYTFLPDVLPNLRFRCTETDGREICLYIFQSGRDGSLLLMKTP